MTREYGTRRSSRSRSGAPHQFLVITVTFLLGYLTASFFDIEMISNWVNTQVLAHQDMKKEQSKPQAQTAIPPKPKFEFYTLLANEKGPGSQANTNVATESQTAPAVANSSTTSVPVATVKAVAANAVLAHVTPGTAIKPNSPTSRVQQAVVATKAVDVKNTSSSTAKGNYLVQVASFKARQDAEHMKGTLILKGFSVYIIPVNHASKGNWFRVVVGPYSNRVLAQQAQISLAKNERLNGMITTGG